MLNGQPGIAMVDNNVPPTVNQVTGANVYLPLTADEEFQAGFACNGVKATLTQACRLSARLRNSLRAWSTFPRPERATTITIRLAFCTAISSTRPSGRTISSTKNAISWTST